ncbi:MAG: GAF domain-containing protein [Pseudonocardiales bacterium]
MSSDATPHGQVSPISVLSRFATVLTRLTGPDLSGSESLPVRLAMGCVDVLPVDAAGISVMDALRIPLGASSADADVLERLQVTVGEGPCIDAFSTSEVVTATQDQIAQNWPIFNDRMLTETRIRSVAALPLQTPKTRLGAVDLYWNSPDGATTLSRAPACELANHIAAILLAEPVVPTLNGVIGPGWIDAASAQRRMQVWQVVGMLNVACGLSNSDAIAVLRAYAYAHDTNLDDLASDLLSGRIPLDEVAPQTSNT